MAVLVTGGAGYIGSHMTHALLDRNEKVVALDNLSTGVKSLVNPDAIFVEGEVADRARVTHLIKEYGIDSVIHFAGSIVVPDSVADPLAYYANNTVASRSLVEACVQAGANHFIFSSTAAVYGVPDAASVTEKTPTEPINPYGRSKLMTEWILEDCSRAYNGFRFIALRYFNVAGADPLGRSGQSNPTATHLIKRACQVALGRLTSLDIYGTDYPTPDGTCVRDYIHVTDLIGAHLHALDALRDGAPSAIYNCGYGKGLSVREIVNALEAVVDRRISVRTAPRRAGDPPSLIANPSKIMSEFKWKPRHDDIQEIIHSALEWERRFNQ